MRKLILLPLVVLYVFLSSCEDEVTDPPVTTQLKFIGLPENLSLGDTTSFDIYYLMTGDYGTSIQFTRQFVGGPFGQYTISARLDIEVGTIPATDTMLCLLSLFTKNTSAIVSPIEQYFAHPFKLTITYTGLDLQNLDLTDLQFVYTNEAGLVLEVTYDSITIDYANGRLEVVNALIQYDPRQVPDAKYGWVRKAE